KKPPRPPNAFILYRRDKQSKIVAANEGISNNEVSKEIGILWRNEPLEVKILWQKLAEEAKLEHMRKYPEYKYRPHRPNEKRRRIRRKKNNNEEPKPVISKSPQEVTNPRLIKKGANSKLYETEAKKAFFYSEKLEADNDDDLNLSTGNNEDLPTFWKKLTYKGLVFLGEDNPPYQLNVILPETLSNYYEFESNFIFSLPIVPFDLAN
ncbi:41755_t:CDS:2, partial [Gigaspora margarita]